MVQAATCSTDTKSGSCSSMTNVENAPRAILSARNLRGNAEWPHLATWWRVYRHGTFGRRECFEKFAGMVKRCADCGFDLAGGLVEVVPTAHYLMGGVIVSPDTRTEIPGLFVAGEDAGGAHGSNRLGGNGVANSTVFGGIAGDQMAQESAGIAHYAEPDHQAIDQAIERTLFPLTLSGGSIHEIREDLLHSMWDHVGVMRTEDALHQG